MKKITVAVAAAAFLLSALPAFAGVVLTQEQSTQDSAGAANKQIQQTVTVQGNKQRIETGDHVIIMDLDKERMYFLDPRVKSYTEMPMPPSGPMAQMMAKSAGAMNFKKDNSTQKIAGYKCQNYTGTATMMSGDLTMVECFSKSAPGATEYSAFIQAMMAKFKKTGMQPTGQIPEGVPLSSVSTMKLNPIKLPSGLSEEQRQKLQKLVENRKVERRVVTTKIVAENVPADKFIVPADYTKREIPHFGGHPGTPPPAPSSH